MITFLSDKLLGLKYVDLIELIARPSVTVALLQIVWSLMK